MSRIDDLIAECCPGGVDFKTIGSIAEVRSGATPSKAVAAYWENGTIPWLNSGEVNKGTICDADTMITQAGYDSCSTRIVPARTVVMALAGQGRTRGTVARTRLECCTNQSLASIVPHSKVDGDFLYHFLRTQYQRLREMSSGDGTRGGLNLGMIRDFKIPVPPPEIQREIAGILDKMELLKAELEAELELRSHQYAFYLDSLLTFTEASQSVRWVPMGEVGTFFRGRRFTKADVVPHGLASIHYGEIYTAYGTFADAPLSRVDPRLAPNLRFASTGDVVIAGVGETVEDVAKAVAWLGEEDVAIHDDTFAFRHSLNPKFVAYYFQTRRFHAEKNKHVARAKVKRISGEGLGKIAIPVLDRDEQDRIVWILDKFDALVNDLSSGIPAEIAARQKQYAYYRDKLLTFEAAS